MGAVLVKFAGVCVRHAAHAACEGDDGDLHSEADAEIRHVVFAAVVRGGDHALYSSAAEAAGDDDPVTARELFPYIFARHAL